MGKTRKNTNIDWRIEANKKFYQVILTWYDENNERKRKSVSTGIPSTPENKEEATKKGKEIYEKYKENIFFYHGDILFADFLKLWLQAIKGTISDSTLKSYTDFVNSVAYPYFIKKKIRLCDLKAVQIENFYKTQQKNRNLSSSTIHHYHAYISGALKYAVRMEYIARNPAELVLLPKKQQKQTEFFTRDEIEIIMSNVEEKAPKLFLPVWFAYWFGMRRGEILGLKWQYVDFENKMIHINGTVTDKNGIEYHSELKTLQSRRSLPLTDEQAEFLKKVKERQIKLSQRPKKFGKYNKGFLEFVCVDELGNLIPPNYITKAFKPFCQKIGVRPLNFHCLRHTNISHLIMRGGNIKAIQEWAGHSSIRTTVDIKNPYEQLKKSKQLDFVCKMRQFGEISLLSHFLLLGNCNLKVVTPVTQLQSSALQP